MRRIVILLILVASLYSQSVVINEIMSSNNSIITDRDGEYPDWLELYNSSDETINIHNYSLSDDEDSLAKWLFPDINIPPKDHLLIFASGKDYTTQIHWETVIDKGDFCKYKIWNSQPPTTWNELVYNDQNWKLAKTGIGYADGDDETVIPEQTISIHARHVFNVENPENVVSCILSIDYDDGFVAYLNGEEIARSNLTGIPPNYNEMASPDHEAVLYTGGELEKFIINDFQDLFQTGDNVLAVEVHNSSQYSSDFSYIPFLTLAMDTPLENPRGPSSYLDFNSTYLHCNFKINASSETVFLSNNSGDLLDEQLVENSVSDVSYGRKPDGSSNWFYFEEPTPGESNITDGFIGFSNEPEFSLDQGLYSGTISLEFTNSTGTIYYTTNGEIPDKNSNLYSHSIEISETTVIRAKLFEENNKPSDVVTKSYIINSEHSLPVISLSTDPYNLWDNDYGIYVLGDDYQNELPYFGANFWQDWERPIHIEYFSTEGDLGFEIDGGVKIYGGWSRADAQKPLALFARSKYGDSKISYQLFHNLNIDEFESVVLRNSANDRLYTMFRDGMMQNLVANTDIDVQAFQPTAVYLNGMYWGLYNLREKLNEHYVSAHYDIDTDNIDFIEGNGIANHGTSDAYWQMYSYLETHNLQINSNYEIAASMIDIDNFIQYEVAQIFYDNTDWPGNNIKCWRKRDEGEKWRWILYDTDFGFGLYDGFGYSAADRYKHNTLQFATATNGPGWPNPPWSTLILRKLLQNTAFKQKFINTYCDFLSTKFKADNVHHIIDSLAANIENEMELHLDRWTNNYHWHSMNTWQEHINHLKAFSNNRPAYARQHIQAKFGLDSSKRLRMKIYPENSGKVQVNTLTITEDFTGYYFVGIPVLIEAVPAPGYKFLKWENLSDTNPKTEIDLSNNITVNAIFEKTSNPTGSIVINEINYNSSQEFDTGDWIEIFNTSNSDIDLSGWIFKDSDDNHSFIFPENMIIESNDFYVLCRDIDKFKTLYPDIINIVGDFDFGLSSNGELIRLYNHVGYLIDSLAYGIDSPWPPEPNGNGSTLILIDATTDNSLAENWTVSEDYGSPVEANSSTSIDDQKFSTKFSLIQNFPNPFNGSTTIRFTINNPGLVNISIYDISGRKVKELVNKHYQIGHYKIQFTPDNSFSSGVYFYKLESRSNQTNIKKLLYLK